MSRVWASLKRLIRDRAGGVAIMLALSLVPLSLAAIGAVDMMRAADIKSQLQDALDAAALTAARDVVADPTNLQKLGAEAFAQNLQDAKITLASGPTFSLGPKREVIADASAKVSDTIMLDLLVGNDFTVSAHSEVASAGTNVEVSLVVDLTDSMDETVNGKKKIDSLKESAQALVDLVVQDSQNPFYSKMAIVPYSSAVYVGSYANAVRGTPARNCTSEGCDKFSFTAADGVWRTWNITDCVTERIGGDAYTDAAPSDAPVGRKYSGSGGACPPAIVTPLTSDKPTLKDTIKSFDTNGTTAGHIGLAWGWYMVSSTFLAQWPDANSRPAAYGTDHLLKFVILMTDGEFNTAYWKGVIAKDSSATSNDQKAAQNATNGSSFTQAGKLCAAIKAKKIIVYTVGFRLTDPNAVAIMNSCATDAAHVYLPTSGTDLQSAFASIGADINRLRITR